MTTIERLADEIRKGGVWWVKDGQAKLCVGFNPAWIETFPVGPPSETPEPVACLEGGTVVALWASEPKDFRRLTPIFDQEASF